MLSTVSLPLYNLSHKDSTKPFVAGLLSYLKAHSTLPVRRAAEEELDTLVDNFKPGPLHSKHIPCPFCPKYYSSPAALRSHKITAHLDQYNEDRAKRGYPPVMPPKKQRNLP